MLDMDRVNGYNLPVLPPAKIIPFIPFPPAFLLTINKTLQNYSMYCKQRECHIYFKNMYIS